jgi:hypothetical protein
MANGPEIPKKELDIPKSAQIDFKGGHSAQGRVVIANNSYYEAELWAHAI